MILVCLTKTFGHSKIYIRAFSKSLNLGNWDWPSFKGEKSVYEQQGNNLNNILEVTKSIFFFKTTFEYWSGTNKEMPLILIKNMYFKLINQT